MRSAILGGARSRIPRPLVHRDEVDVGLILHERLGAVAVVHIPIDDQHPVEAVLLPRVVRRAGDASENAETHRAVAQRVMTRRAHRAEAPVIRSGCGEIDSHEDGARRRRRGVPAPLARDRIGVETASAGRRNRSDRLDVRRIVAERQLLGRRVPALEMFDSMKKIRLLAQRARDRAKTSDVFRMTPSGVVTAAIAVRNERGARYETGRRRRSAMSSMAPSFTPASASETLSSRISKPCSFTTNSSDEKESG